MIIDERCKNAVFVSYLVANLKISRLSTLIQSTLTLKKLRLSTFVVLDRLSCFRPSIFILRNFWTVHFGIMDQGSKSPKISYRAFVRGQNIFRARKKTCYKFKSCKNRATKLLKYWVKRIINNDL